jgi:hypothetical protein
VAQKPAGYIPNVVLETEKLARSWLRHVERTSGPAFELVMDDVGRLVAALLGAFDDWTHEALDDKTDVFPNAYLLEDLAMGALEHYRGARSVVEALLAAGHCIMDGKADEQDALRDRVVLATHQKGDTAEYDDHVRRSCDEYFPTLFEILAGAVPTLRMLAALAAPVTSTQRTARTALPAWFKPSTPAQTKALRAVPTARMVRGRVVMIEPNDVVVFLEQSELALCRTHIPNASELLTRWCHFVMLASPVGDEWYAALAAPVRLELGNGEGYREAMEFLAAVKGNPNLWGSFPPWVQDEPLRTFCATLVFEYENSWEDPSVLRFLRTARGLPSMPVECRFELPAADWEAILALTQTTSGLHIVDDMVEYRTAVEKPSYCTTDREYEAMVAQVSYEDDGQALLTAEHPDFARELLALLWPDEPKRRDVELTHIAHPPGAEPWFPEAPEDQTVDQTLVLLTPEEQALVYSREKGFPSPDHLHPKHGLPLRDMIDTVEGAVAVENLIREFERRPWPKMHYCDGDAVRVELGLATVADLVGWAPEQEEARRVLNRPMEQA